MTQKQTKQNKYVYLFVVQGYYGGHWEDLTQSESFKEMRDDLKAYRNEEGRYTGTRFRMIRRRELASKYAKPKRRQAKPSRGRGMTKAQAVQIFKEDIRPYLQHKDKVAVRCAWNDWVDTLHKSLQITDSQVNNWKNPFDR